MVDQTKYSTKLVDARILIIGGSSGLGYGVAEACIEHGAVVTIASSSTSRVSTAVDKIKAAYPSKASNISGLTADLSKPETLEGELDKLFKSATSKIGRDGKLDHVVYTAGDALSMMKLEGMTVEKIIQAGQLRFFAPLLTAKYVQRYVHASPRSSYTLTTGSIADRPRPDWSVIGSYAGGHHSMVRQLALDLKPIRANAVSPGAVDTELWKMPEEQKQGFFRMLEEKLPTGVVGRVEQVAETYLAVLKDSNMDAEVVRSDGGAFAM